MNFLFGDSSESNLDFNYLAFLREALDCAVVLVDHETTLGSGDRRRAKEKDAQLAIQSIEELGRHARDLFDPVVKEYSDSPVGRAADAITSAVRDVIAVETAKVQAALGTALEQLSADDQKLRARSLAALEKLLRTYDLPDASRAYEIAWSGTSAPKKIVVRLATPYGVEAVLDAALPAASLFATGELRVDKLADGVEIASVEAGGWIKKSDKVTPYKLGRYFITRVATGGREGTALRLRMTQDANAPGFNLISRGIDDFALERVGDTHEKDGKAREYTIDDRNRPALRALIEKVEAAARTIGAGEARALTAITIDGATFADSPHPQTIAERLMLAMGPTVKDIAAHSSNANELVLRRMLGDDRREEIFVAISELTKKLDAVPEAARRVFAPLGIDRRAVARAPKPPTQPPPIHDARPRSPTGSGARTVPPPPPGAHAQSGPVPLPGMTTPTGSMRAVAAPTATTVVGLPVITAASAGAPSVSGTIPATPTGPITMEIALPRTTSDTIDIANVEELPEDDIAPSASGSVNMAALTRAIDDALDEPAAKPKKQAAVVDDGDPGEG